LKNKLGTSSTAASQLPYANSDNTLIHAYPPTPPSCPLVFELEDELCLAMQVYNDAKCTADSSITNNQKANSSDISSHHGGMIDKVLYDSRWNIIAGYQASYLGQLQRYLEQLAALNSFNPFSGQNATGTPSEGK
jgi:hypothetical protein